MKVFSVSNSSQIPLGKDPSSKMDRGRPSKNQLLNVYFGNLFEHYDTALFGLLSAHFALIFFPKQDPIIALILTFAIIPLGQIARPIGSLFFGYIGDIYGRERALFLSLMGMSIVTGLIAFTPAYYTAGIFAPICLGLGRILQNFFAAGETIGGGIFLLESFSKKKHDLLSGFFSTSTIGGYLLASLGVFLLTYFDGMEWGWRGLYLLGSVTAFYGGWMRKKGEEKSVAKKFLNPVLNLKRTLWGERNHLFLIAIVSGFSYVTFSVVFILMNTFVPLISRISKTEIAGVSTSLFLLDFLTLPFFGWVSSRISREKMMMIAAMSVFLLSPPLVQMLNGATFGTVIFVRSIFILFGVSFTAPFYSWTLKLVPKHSRYTVISFGYAIGCLVFGSPSVAISLWVFKATNIVSSVVWYWMGLSLASTVVLYRQIYLSKKEGIVDKRF